jgi:hypothetical protein
MRAAQEEFLIPDKHLLLRREQKHIAARVFRQASAMCFFYRDERYTGPCFSTELQQKYIIMQHDCFDRKYRLGYTFYRCRTKKLKAERCRVRTDADIGGFCRESDIPGICRGNIAGAGTEKRVIWHWKARRSYWKALKRLMGLRTA